MSWSPAGPTAPVVDRLGWTPDGPVAPPSPGAGWLNVPQAAALDGAVVSDAALLEPGLTASDGAASSDTLYMGLDPANDFEVRIRIRDCAVASGTAALGVDAQALDSAAAADRARLRLRGLDSAVPADRSLMSADVFARDAAAPADRTTVGARVRGRDAAALGDGATAGFAAMAPTASTFTTPGTFTIPVWCRFISYAVLGGGGGGGRHNSFSVFTGRGGEAGQWQTGILERGVHIPWTATTITVAIGAAGAGGALNGTAGGATTISIPGVGTITAAGGAGGLGDQNGSPTSGGSPGDVSVDGQTYSGGTGGLFGTGSRQPAVGTAPGAGGGGGGGGLANGQQNGVNGAIGRAWLRARQ
ncbi:minor tail protein [Gordonia phage RavenCo17]|nr:minor tail protein [Gordonia phage RavenCo17]